MSQTQVTLRSKLDYVTLYQVIGLTDLTAFACDPFGFPRGTSLRKNAKNNGSFGAS